jgi:hypothetical protein
VKPVPAVKLSPRDTSHTTETINSSEPVAEYVGDVDGLLAKALKSVSKSYAAVPPVKDTFQA